MKKTIITLASFGLLAFGITNCGGGSGSAPISQAAVDANQIQINKMVTPLLGHKIQITFM